MIVLPIKKTTYHTQKNEFVRFAKIGLLSLEHFLDPTIQILVICPKDQLSEAKQIIKSDILTIQFMADEDLLSINTNGWTKQMLIKLLVANFINEPYYLVLDADCILTKPLCINDFFFNGRLIGCKEIWQDSDKKYYAVSNRWWKNSNSFLNPFMVEIEKNVNHMSVTPEILITSQVLELMDKLQGRHKDWLNAFVQFGATEYCTYWIHLMEEGKTCLYDLSNDAPSLWKMDLTTSWLYNDSSSTLIQTMINAFNAKEYFTVVQSHTNVDIEELSKIIKDYLIPVFEV
jgi:hypothetical protein